MDNKYNLFFCLDNNYIEALPYVFRSFIVNNDPKLYNINFITYNIKKTKIINNILLKISPDFNIIIKKFIPSKDFIILLKSYHNFLSNFNHMSSQSLNTFTNLGNWSRFFMHELFPEVEYGLYLDLDILFNNSIIDLVENVPKEKLIGVIPYKKKKIINREQLLIKNFNNKIFKIFKIDSNLLNNESYNCGVVYYNLKKWKEENITNRILNLLIYSIRNNILLFYSGTEVIQNLLIPEYKTYSKKYNKIYNKSNVKKLNFSIIHFKGIKHHWKDKVYLDTYIRIINKLK